MDRRKFVAALGGALVAPLARAQRPASLPPLGVLTPHPAETREQRERSPYRARLRELGWIDGETYEMVRPDAGGREDRLPEIADELVRRRVNVIWAIGPEAAVAAARATQTIPIVFWGVAAPVEQGLIDSLARPGRNVTGVAFAAGAESTKALEALAEIAPQAKRIALVVTTSATATTQGERVRTGVERIHDAARKLAMESRAFEVAKVEDFETAFESILKWRAQAVFVFGTTLTFRERKRIASFAIKNRLASAFNQWEFVESGGLLSYGIDSVATGVQTVAYIDRILRGARPGDLPVELPSKFQFVVNLATAKLLGFKIPQAVLARADRVIE